MLTRHLQLGRPLVHSLWLHTSLPPPAKMGEMSTGANQSLSLKTGLNTFTKTEVEKKNLLYRGMPSHR